MDPRTLLLVGLVVTAGCAAPAPDEGTEEPWLTVEATPERFEVGTWTNVTITFENKGDEPYTYDHPGCPPEPFRVEATGQDVTVRLYDYSNDAAFGACVVQERTLEPGQRISAVVQWNGRTQDEVGRPHQGEAAPAGAYEVVAELARADQGDRFTARTSVTLEA